VCRSEVSDYQAYFDENGLPTAADLYTVSTSVRPSGDAYPPSEWLAEAGWTVPTLVDDADNSAADAFGLTAFPFTVFVDGDGVVIGRLAGGIRVETLVAFIEQMGG
jgi:hypothetical protein